MTTYTFDFQKITDNLTIEVRIRPAHQRQVYQQMIQRFEQTGGKAGMGMPMRIAALVLIGVGLVGTVVVIQGVRTQKLELRSSPQQIVQPYIDNRDISGLIGLIDHQSEPIQLAAITALGQIGDATALAALTALLETPITDPVRTATLAAIDQLRLRLNGSMSVTEPNQSVNEVQPRGGSDIEATAQLELPAVLAGFDFEHSHFSIQGRANLETLGATDMNLVLPEHFMSDGYQQWIETEAGQAYKRIVDQVNKIEDYRAAASVYNTGLLHLHEVPSGDYWLTGTFVDTNGNDIAKVRCPLTVPSGSDSTNLGTLVLEQVPAIEIGQLAPNLTLFGLNGKSITLEQFRGQYLVLDLGFKSYRGSTYARNYVPVLQKASQMPSIRILSVDVSWGFPIASITPYMQKQIKSLGITWPLGLSDGAYSKEDISLNDYIGPGHFPSLMLLDPDGRIVATKLPVEKLIQAIDIQLGTFSGP